ncbi:MAG: sugar phosphate isomerase/epimerase [Clostridia bacterium]|nr:sugar phosphate isomerase/epimerase [Clostridia bacterium]
MAGRQWLLATLSEDAPRLAAEHGLGLEIDAFCTAANMDEGFPQWDAAVRGQLAVAPGRVLHAPFAELFPCAIDPAARALAMQRLCRAADIARGYGIRRMVAHSGFIPRVYFPEWFEARSAEFWREFLEKQGADFELLVENVLDEDPRSLARMLEAVNDPRARFCLDVGHANVASPRPLSAWVEALAPFLSHVHLHDNHGGWDEHNPPGGGTIDIAGLLALLDRLAPKASVTLECPDAAGAAAWVEGLRRHTQCPA